VVTELKPQIQLLGEMRIVYQGQSRALPQSRKSRGLLAYLALVARRHRREELCELLWDSAGDPRAGLRWSLSKLRPLLSVNDQSALQADRESVALDLNRVTVDVLDIRALLADQPENISDQDLMDLDKRFTGTGLDGLDDVGTRRFQLWLESERKLLDELHRQALDELMSRKTLTSTLRLRLAAKRVALDPLHDASNTEYLGLLRNMAGVSDAQQAFQKMRDYYRAERQSDSALVAAWRGISQLTAAPRDASPGELMTNTIDPAETHEVHPLPDKPSLAVLDFSDLSSHPDGAVLARGLAVDLNSRLAQLPSLFVIARQSATRIDSASLTPRQIGAKLGVRYLINGSTQRENKRIRTTVSLLDTANERELWSDHFDRPLDDIFEIQDDITNSVIAAIEPAIEWAEMQRALIKPPGNLTAWELFHRGLWHCFRFTTKDNEVAHQLFTQALAMDSRFARAHAGISFTHYSRAFLHTVSDVETEVQKALESGRKSIGFDGRDAMGHWSLGRALFLSRQHDDALLAIDQALAVNPNYAQGFYAKGFIGIHANADEASLPSLDKAQRLSPYDPLLFAMKSSRAISLANQGRYDEAASWAIRGTQEPNAHFHIYAVAAACLELAGRSSDARNNAGWVLQRRPDYTVGIFQRSFPHKDEASRERMLAALARTGIARQS
jgi:TolB-like protein/DNA-binding SARP family transcriptional activator